MTEFRVFLSAVTSEFGQARDALAASLRSREMLVRVQSDFRQQAAADTTLRKLHDYIRDCSAVVCLIGTRSGAMPPAAAAAPFTAMLPAGVSEASYTQWEFFFARHYQRRLSLYIAAAGWKPDEAAPPDDAHDLQQALIRHIEHEQGLDRERFGDVHHLCHLVLKEDWPREKPAKPILLPYPSLGALFKGRDAFMRRLRASLTRTDGGRAAIAGAAVQGLGGVGKTRAAVEYAWAYRDEYAVVALLDAETPERLQSSLAALAGPLRLAAEAVAEEAVRVEAVLSWFGNNPAWLLILDNVDTQPALAAAHRLLGRLTGGHVVITSRLGQFPRGVEPLDLDVLDLGDAAEFLLAATAGRPEAADDAAQARLLAEALGQLALALEMAAATIQARKLTIAGYQALWQGNRKRVVGWARPEITGYHHAVAETWQTSVDQLTPEGRMLLERLSFLSPEPVPVSLLDVKRPGTPDDEDAHAALDNLATYSLASRDPVDGSFLVHRLVLDVTRRGLTVAGTDKARLPEALHWIDAAFIGNAQDVRIWPVLNPLTPHAEAVTGFADAAGIAEPTVQLMGRLGALFNAKSLHGPAEIYSRRALAIAEASFPPADPRLATHLNNLAVLLRAINRLGEAEPLMRRALATDETSYGLDHPDVAIRLNNLARVAASHQPARRGGTADAARAGDRRGELRPRPSERRDATSTTSRSCCRRPTGWTRRNR